MKIWTVAGLGAILVLMAGCAPSAAELRERAVAEFQLGNTEQAQQLLDRSLDKEPFNALSLFYMGRIKHVGGFYEQAMHFYQKALIMDPGLEEARKWLARAEEQLGPTGKRLRYVPDLSPAPTVDK